MTRSRKISSRLLKPFGFSKGCAELALKEAAAVGAQFLDGLLGGDGAARDVLGGSGEGLHLVHPGEVLHHAGRHQGERAEERDRQQDAHHSAHHVGPEVAQFPGARPGEAADEGDGDGIPHGGRDEVLHCQPGQLHQMAHGGLARVGLPVGVGDEGGGGVERLVRVECAESQGQRQPVLEPLQGVEEEHSGGREGQHRADVGGCAHPGVRIGADAAVKEPLDAQMPVGAVDGGHVVAERPVHQRERSDERHHLEHGGERGTHRRSEPLREEQGADEVAQQREGHHEPRGVLCAHSRSIPLATSDSSAKTATVVAAKARSAIVCAPGE